MSMLFNAGLPDSVSQLHALVVGVEDYDYLPGDIPRQRIALHSFNLSQLHCTVNSASGIADWLLSGYYHPTRELGSLTLLLSPTTYHPSREASARLGGEATAIADVSIAHQVNKATQQNIQQAFKDLVRRCGRKDDNVLFFYFCGHGMEATHRYLLPADYGADDDDPFGNLINLSVTFNTMRSCRARTQLFLIDACRAHFEDLQDAAEDGELGHPLQPVKAGSKYETDTRLLHGTTPGQLSFGQRAGKAIFTETLLDCLNGIGVKPPPEDGRWPMDITSLSQALSELLPLKGQKLDHSSPTWAAPPSEVFHTAPSPARAVVSVKCVPETAHATARLAIEDNTGAVQYRNVPEKVAYKTIVPAGTCQISVEFDPSTDWKDILNSPRVIAPPVTAVTLSMQS